MHKFGEWTELSKSTCTEKGIMERTCECGFTEEKSVSLLPHNALAASCTEASFCKDCGALTGPQLGHSVVEATCTTPAYCADCKSEMSPALGHQAVNASCTEGSFCRICGERFADSLGHFLREASCTVPECCMWCGYTVKDALGHDWLAASCTEPKTCARCQVTEGMPNGHAWNNMGSECLICGINRINTTMGIYMNGDFKGSHSAQMIYDTNTSAVVEIELDGIVHIEFQIEPRKKSRVWTEWMVDKDINLNIEEYPVAFVLTRNLCTCYASNGTCYALESCHLNLIAGEVSIPIRENMISETNMAQQAIERDGDSFLYFYNDYSTNNPGEQKGRIGGLEVRLDVLYEKAETCAFDICYIGFFKTLEDAKLYMGEYLEQLYPTENATIGKDIVYTETDLQTEDAEDTEVEIEIEEETEVETLG